MEPRRLLAANPLVVGGVYIEEDLGSDLQGDTFELTFQGGAPGTNLTRVIIDGDHRTSFGNLPGLSSGDIVFDIVERPDSIGADHAFPFTLRHVLAADGSVKQNASVTATVTDGGLQLVLDLVNVTAGDRLVFSIDVDEIQHFDPNETDFDKINDGIDPLTSGAEFHGSLFTAHFSAPNYHDLVVDSKFLNRYDNEFAQANAALGAGENLQLPSDNQFGNRDRTAGAIAVGQQAPLPISISGTVFHDRNFDLTQQLDQGETGIGNVALALYQQNEAGQYVPVVRGGVEVTTLTSADGHYEFGSDLQLLPGTYQVRESQPTGFDISVGAIPGTVSGIGSGNVLDSNTLSGISIPLGGTQAVNYDFAEANPAQLAGCVYHDRNNDGVQQLDADEQGIAGVRLRLLDRQGSVVAETLTGADGCYLFTGIAGGEYRLEEVQPTSWIDGLDSPGRVDGVSRGQIAGNDAIAGIVLRSGEAGSHYNFGERLARVSGRVHVDRDGDCIFDENEQPLAGVTMLLIDSSGKQISTTTDASGRYEFVGVSAGTYSIVQQQPAGYFNGHQRAGNRGGDVSQANVISGVVIGGDTVVLENYDFCEELGSLSGYVYHDRNNDGQRDPSSAEEAIAGVRLRLLDSAGAAVRDAQGTPRTTVTDENGFYRFDDLPPGVYTIVEEQPAGWLDGRDTPGFVGTSTVSQVPVGSVIANDQLGQIALVQSGQVAGSLHGHDYNFGELRAASLSGRIHTDINGNCVFEPGATFPQPQQRELPLAGITVRLRDADGRVVAETQSDAEGRYQLEQLMPGNYTLEQVQPPAFFDVGQTAGTLGGNATVANRISNIAVGSGQQGEHYNFCEAPAARISGFVFQDGASLLWTGGDVQPQVHLLRDGERTDDDTPISGVLLELRNGLDGSPVIGTQALSGIYGAGPIRVRTDANGFYEFVGLPRGNYAVYQVHPFGYTDSIDTPGSTQGVAWNAHQAAPLAILSRLSNNPPPPFDGILNIALGYGQTSVNNNFSEVRIVTPPSLPEPPSRPLSPIPVTSVPPLPAPTFFPLPPPAVRPEIPLYGGSGQLEYTWHLSIIDAGRPRGANDALTSDDEHFVHVSTMHQNWMMNGLRAGQWTLPTAIDVTTLPRQIYFGLPGAIPVAGDFDGDGRTDVGIYYQGDWFLDVNGNGQWDSQDLWARLGDQHDQPVVGDWNGDGKDDIGIFGPIWAGDVRAIANEPGLPDAKNVLDDAPKNLPPVPDEATNGLRILRLTEIGANRGDLIDHVFRFGGSDDRPVAGDWDGDGIDNIGVFSNGKWILDVDGDGRLTASDREVSFGQAGDIPLVGDFNGNGIDEVGVFRNGQVILDSNGNAEMDAADQVFELLGQGRPVVGDFDSDGVDDVATYE